MTTETICLWIHAAQSLAKGRPAGIDRSAVRVGSLYLLDWRPTSDDVDTVTLDLVERIEDGQVYSRGGYTDLATFASLVVAGPIDMGS